jgi:hypothetical protein
MLQTQLQLGLHSIANQGGLMPSYWSAISSTCDCNEVTGLEGWDD